MAKKNKINVIRLEGVIASSKKGLCLKNMRKYINKAFDDKKAKAVAIIINSPGGSPSQSEILANYVMYKSQQTKKEVITFAEDVAASGGYWLAMMGSQFFALSSTSIVGSLGVLYSGFGLEDFISRYGIKRRVYTAGKSKVSLDMFQQEKEEDVKRLKLMLEQVHTHFKNWVLSRRKEKLNQDEDIFTGEFWIASKAIEKGLVDGIVDLEPKLKELYGSKIKINYLEAKKSILPQFLSQKIDHSNSISEDIIEEIKNEISWNRFGL